LNAATAARTPASPPTSRAYATHAAGKGARPGAEAGVVRRNRIIASAGAMVRWLRFLAIAADVWRGNAQGVKRCVVRHGLGKPERVACIAGEVFGRRGNAGAGPFCGQDDDEIAARDVHGRSLLVLRVTEPHLRSSHPTTGTSA
jgi:hypothetical protein